MEQKIQDYISTHKYAVDYDYPGGGSLDFFLDEKSARKNFDEGDFRMSRDYPRTPQGDFIETYSLRVLDSCAEDELKNFIDDFNECETDEEKKESYFDFFHTNARTIISKSSYWENGELLIKEYEGAIYATRAFPKEQKVIL